MIKALSKAGIKRNVPHLDEECLQKKTTANIILNDKILKAFLCKLKSKDRMCSLTSLFKYHTGSPANVVRQEKEVTYIQIGKEKIQLLSFSDEMITYTFGL